MCAKQKCIPHCSKVQEAIDQGVGRLGSMWLRLLYNLGNRAKQLPEADHESSNLIHEYFAFRIFHLQKFPSIKTIALRLGFMWYKFCKNINDWIKITGCE